MKAYKYSKIDGFTILEVIIVLVIAAVIMILVFLVVPQLQRSQRNTQRRKDADAILTALETLAGRSGGSYTTTTITDTGIIGLTGGAKDPSSKVAYTIKVNTTDAATDYDATGEIEVLIGKGCDKVPGGTTPTGNGKAAVVIFLEGGSTYCTSFP